MEALDVKLSGKTHHGKQMNNTSTLVQTATEGRETCKQLFSESTSTRSQHENYGGRSGKRKGESAAICS